VLTGTASTFVGNAGIFGKVYFPRLAVPIATLISKLIAFAIQFFFFLCFLGYFMVRGAEIQPNAWVLATPLLLLMMAAFGLGFGTIISSLTTRYRDLTVLVGFGVQLLMYMSAIVYPVSALPAPYDTWIMLNPVVPIVELFRYAYLGAGSLHPGYLVYAFIAIALLLVGGVMLFNRVERTFMDTV
jgi:lipopolysaccharide transport system permease protein